PVTNWPIYTINDQVSVDYIGRFETMDQDLKELGSCLQLNPTLKLPPRKAKGNSRKTSGVELYNARTIALVERIYKKELEQFNYSFDDFACLHAGG
ncbi:MAG: hypothetical protein ACLFU3_01555, partial [Dichotomicrobium sp.]